jgi:hypothetical protein
MEGKRRLYRRVVATKELTDLNQNLLIWNAEYVLGPDSKRNPAGAIYGHKIWDPVNFPSQNLDGSADQTTI